MNDQTQKTNESIQPPIGGVGENVVIRKKRLHSIRKQFLLTVALMIPAAFGGQWLYQQYSHVVIDDARIAADMVVLSSRVPGYVTAINVIAGDRIRKGKVIVEIDNRESLLKVKEIDTRLRGINSRREEFLAQIRLAENQTVSRIKEKQAILQSGRAKLETKIARWKYLKGENKRAERLSKSGAVTRARLEETRAGLDAASHQIASAQADIQTAEAAVTRAKAERGSIRVLKSQLASLDPEEQQLQILRAQMLLDLEDRVITMPFDGVVDRVFVDEDEHILPNQRILMVHDPQRVRVEANVKETDVRFFKRGMIVHVTIDAFPGLSLEGTVERIGQAATSEYSLLPKPNPSGNFTKITQRLPVRISVTQQDGLLRPGMMVEVEARIHE